MKTTAETLAVYRSNDIDTLEDFIESLTDDVQLTDDYYGINMATFADGSWITWNHKLEIDTGSIG